MTGSVSRIPRRRADDSARLPTCPVCHGPVTAVDEQIRLGPSQHVHWSCATYELRLLAALGERRARRIAPTSPARPLPAEPPPRWTE